MAEAPTHSPEAMKFNASGIAIRVLIGDSEKVKNLTNKEGPGNSEDAKQFKERKDGLNLTLLCPICCQKFRF